MGFSSHCVTSPWWCYSTEDYNERQNNFTNIVEERLNPERFQWTYCVDCEEYKDYAKIVCPYQPTHNVSLSCDDCGNVYIDYYYYRYKFNPTCSHDCYVKHNTIQCIDCETKFLRTGVSVRCSSCSVLKKIKIKNGNAK